MGRGGVGGGVNYPLHGRTMDWDMPALERLAIEVEFQQAGKTVFLATTWAGYVGVLTGMRPGAWSVSINYRRTGTNIRDVLTNFVKVRERERGREGERGRVGERRRRRGRDRKTETKGQRGTHTEDGEREKERMLGGRILSHFFLKK
jgi:hypothetical protein